MDEEQWKQLMEIRVKYRDLATWEIRTLSASDTDNMLGVMTMAVASGEGAFKWRFASGTPCISENKRSKTPRVNTCLDAPETLSLVETPWEDSESSVSEQIPQTPDEILDDALRRGGSSLEVFRAEPEQSEYSTETNEDTSDDMSSKQIVPVRFNTHALIQDVRELLSRSFSTLT
jgi:hypothetical protein